MLQLLKLALSTLSGAQLSVNAPPVALAASDARVVGVRVVESTLADMSLRVVVGLWRLAFPGDLRLVALGRRPKLVSASSLPRAPKSEEVDRVTADGSAVL